MSPVQAVILAAGRGTRLGELSQKRSKAMQPVIGEPMVGRALQELQACGIERFVVVHQPGDQELLRYFEAPRWSSLEIELVPQPEQLGSAHAMQLAAHKIHSDFLLTACDNLFQPDELKEFISSWRSRDELNGLMALIPTPDDLLSRSGVVGLDGNWVTHLVEKPSLEQAPSNIVSMSLYCFSRRLLDYLPSVKPSPRGEYELPGAIQRLIEEHGFVGGHFFTSRLTLTTANDLLEINLEYLRRLGCAFVGDGAQHDQETSIHAPVHLEAGAQVGAGCTIGPYVFLERGCRVGDGARLTNTLVLQEAQVPAGAVLENQVVY